MTNKHQRHLSTKTRRKIEKATVSSSEGGFCKVHNLQGSKCWIPTKTRKKKPNGIYGYVYGKKVGYKCSMTQFLPPSNTDEKTNPIFNTDGVVCNTEKQGVLSTFTTFNNLDEASRMKSESRLPGNIFEG